MIWYDPRARYAAVCPSYPCFAWLPRFVPCLARLFANLLATFLQAFLQTFLQPFLRPCWGPDFPPAFAGLPVSLRFCLFWVAFVSLAVACRQHPTGEQRKSHPEISPNNKPDNNPDNKPETKPGGQPESKPESKPGNGETSPEDGARPAHGPLMVFAASSLQDVFPDLARAFTRREKGALVQFSFAGSQTLRLQIEHGAPAHIFASAHPTHGSQLQAQGLMQGHRAFARNELTVIYAKDVRRRVGLDVSRGTRLEPQGRDVARAAQVLERAQRLVFADAVVPLGIYTNRVLRQMATARPDGWERQIRRKIVSLENNARRVRVKLALGEADAAIVYKSDLYNFGACRRRLAWVRCPFRQM